jgi:hypothetical protein
MNQKQKETRQRIEREMKPERRAEFNRIYSEKMSEVQYTEQEHTEMLKKQLPSVWYSNEAKRRNAKVQAVLGSDFVAIKSEDLERLIQDHRELHTVTRCVANGWDRFYPEMNCRQFHKLRDAIENQRNRWGWILTRNI